MREINIYCKTETKKQKTMFKIVICKTLTKLGTISDKKWARIHKFEYYLLCNLYQLIIFNLIIKKLNIFINLL